MCHVCIIHWSDVLYLLVHCRSAVSNYAQVSRCNSYDFLKTFYTVVFIVSGEVRHSHPRFVYANLQHLQYLVWSRCKQTHLLLLCCISDNIAAEGVLAVVINRTCCYHGNHRSCQTN